MEQGETEQPEPAVRGRGSIGRRIMTLVALAVLVSVLLASSLFFWIEAKTRIEYRRSALEATAYVFASAIADDVATNNAQDALRVLRSISRMPDITYAVVTDARGKQIASLGSAVLIDGAAFAPENGILAALATASFPAAVDIVKAGKPVGQLILVANISDLRSQLLLALLSTLLVAVLACAAGVAVANSLQRRITAPIVRLTETMRRVRDTSDYAAQVDHVSNDETGLLVDAFNGMIGEINLRDRALERHRQTLESTVAERTHELSLAKDAAVSANQAKSGFLATMSHEIRTPMNGLMVMAELLAAAGLEPRQQRYADVIVKSGESLLSIINDVLDLSKIEAGKLQLESIAVDPAGVADDVISLFWEQASAKGLDLAARVAPNVPRAILGDPVRLNQILSNLVNNALKFTARGQVLISLQYDGARLSISVADSGIGIAPEKLGSLFEAFAQADKSTTRKFGGSGLGLTICKRLAQAMGGTIAVHSEMAKGSRFTVAIPVTIPEEAAAPRPLAAGRGRAAIAVDGLATLSGLGTALQAAGFEVEALSGDGDGYDVIFVATSRLKSLTFATSARPKLICISGLGDTRAAAAVSAGLADGLMLLPLRQADIATVLERLASGETGGHDPRQLGTAQAQAKPSFAGRRVLVADDNAVNREVVIEVLRQLDVTAETVGNGIEAVEAWRRHRPDLIFMDCSMPEMDGYAATREIRAHEKLDISASRTPIVALTAQVAGLDSLTWREAGMDAFLTKPFTMKTIIACLNAQFEDMPLATPGSVANAADDGRPVLDQSVIDDLKQIGGSDALFRRVLDLFAARVPQAVDKVASLAATADLGAMADAAHALKSMCTNVGAVRATAACHDLEHAARTGQVFDAGEKIGIIAAEMRAVVAAIERLRAA